MKIRIAKKILTAKHWCKRWNAMRPMFFDEKKGKWTMPSWHDIPDKQFQKARTRYFTYYKRAGRKK